MRAYVIELERAVGLEGYSRETVRVQFAGLPEALGYAARETAGAMREPSPGCFHAYRIDLLGPDGAAIVRFTRDADGWRASPATSSLGVGAREW